MNVEKRKVFTALMLTLCLIAPMAISFGHTFHHHEKSVCQAESEFHIHEFELPCDDLHYFSQTPDFLSQELDFNHLKVVTDSSLNQVNDLCSRTLFNNLLDRGPPLSIIE